MDDRIPGSRNLLPISVKGVLLGEGGVVLLENEREEWELCREVSWKRGRARRSA